MDAVNLNKKIQENKNFNIFDIRQKQKYIDFHLKGAIHMEKGLLLEKPEEHMNKHEKYYVTCNGGNSARLIANILKNQGYDIEHLIGGMNILINQKN